MSAVGSVNPGGADLSSTATAATSSLALEQAYPLCGLGSGARELLQSVTSTKTTSIPSSPAAAVIPPSPPHRSRDCGIPAGARAGNNGSTAKPSLHTAGLPPRDARARPYARGSDEC